MRTPLRLMRADLRMLLRARTLAVVLVAYPLLVALVIGAILLHQGPPRIAFVNEDLTGDELQIGEDEFSVNDYVERAERQGVEVVRLERDEADRALDDGQVAGVLVIPQGTMAKLRTQLSGAPLEFHIGDGALGTIVAQRMRGIIYQVNLSISSALIEANRGYLETLVEGGKVNVNGDEYDLYGLDPVAEDLEDVHDELEELPDVDEGLLDRIDRAMEFAGDAGAAIGLADNALEATAAPIRLKVSQPSGTSPLLTAQAMAFALATLLAFVCVVVVAASLAGERQEAVLSRLLRGIASPWQVVAGKLLLGALLGAVMSTGLFVAFAILEPQAWARLPLLLLGAVLVSAAAGGLGALIAVITRDARTATLVGILVVLPLVPLMLVRVDPPLSWIVDVVPLDPARGLFNAILFEREPWDELLRRGSQLVVVTLLTGALATRMLRRLA